MDTKLVKGVFWIVGMCVAAMLLYVLLFVGDNSALRHACRAVETPMSQTYYEMALYPSVHETEGLASSLGYAVDGSSTDFSLNEPDTASANADYSTGWN